MINIKALNKTYSGKFYETKALVDVSLHIKRGELVAIMGSSGSGKTTLLNMIGLVDDYDSGSIEIDGNVITPRNKEKIRIKYISYIFQHFALIETDTVYENIELPMISRKISKVKRKQVITDLLEKLGISQLKNQMPNKISGGQKQRVAIARALASDTPIILADEPTGALDVTNSREVMNILKSLSKEDKTVIIVTHDINVAKEADRVICIENGSIVG